MNLSEKLIECRKKSGLSQVDLADAIGVSRQSVSKWETGESNPDITKLPRIAALFGVTTDWLLSDRMPDASMGEEQGEAMETSAPSAVLFPDWVERLPQHLGRMVRRYGWLYGVRLALGGLGITAFGMFARLMFKRTILGSAIPGMTGMPPGFHAGMTLGLDGFQQSAWGSFSFFTGGIILLGVVLMAAGAGLAYALKKWGKKNQ